MNASFRRGLSLIYLISTVASISARAADLPRLRAHFEETFASHYEPRLCGKNIARLIESAGEEAIDLEDAYFLKIESESFWQLQAFSPRGYAPGKRQPWSFHVVLVADGFVFDYDFTNRPRVLPADDYFFEMFVPQGPTDLPQYRFEKTIRETYALSFYDAREILKNAGSTAGLRARETMLADYVDLDRLFARLREARAVP